MGDELDIHSGYASSTCEEEEGEAFAIDAAAADADAAAADAPAAASSAASFAAEGGDADQLTILGEEVKEAEAEEEEEEEEEAQCGGAAVRQHAHRAAVRECGTPGCELAAYHEGPCQSQQVVGRTRLTLT